MTDHLLEREATDQMVREANLVVITSSTDHVQTRTQMALVSFVENQLNEMIIYFTLYN